MLLFLPTESWLACIATVNCHANFVLFIVDIYSTKKDHKTAPNYIRSVKKERKNHDSLVVFKSDLK